MKVVFRFVSLGFAMWSLTSALSAQILLVGWEVTGVDIDDNLPTGISSSPHTLSGTAATSEISGGNLTLGGGTNPTTSGDQYGFKISGADEQTTLAGAINENHFIQFTVTAASGYTFTPTSIDMLGGASSTGSTNVALLTSVDGFSDGDEIASVSGVNSGAGGFDTDSSGFGGSITLSGMQYQDLTSVTFRLYGWGTTNGSGTTFLRTLASGNDLEVFGTVSAVPEPSSFAALLGLGALGLVATRRRGRKTHSVGAA